MTTDTELRAASDAAYRWVDLLSDVCYWAEYAQAPDGAASRADAATVAFAKLYQLRWELDRYGPTLDAEVDRLAAVSEGIVRHPGMAEEPKSYTSAHEAVKDIAWRAVFVLLETAGLSGRELPDDWRQIAEQQLTRHWRRFAIDASLMRARIRRERVKLIPAKPPEPPATSESEQGSMADKTVTYPTVEEHMERLAQAVGDENAAEIMKIASRKDWPGERRMEEIHKLDRRFAGKDSNDWAKLLGVSPAAVRGYGLWKRLQREKKADR